MKYLLPSLALVFAVFTPPAYSDTPGAPDLPRVRIQTSMGDIVVELDKNKAPKTVENFLGYVKEKAYDGTLFHRVVKDFMIQGGVVNASYEPRPTRAAIQSEANNGLKNDRGTIAMARDFDPHSAKNQFFINTMDNLHLNHSAPKEGYWGYTVFGKVTQGMDVVDRINNIPTGPAGIFVSDVPKSLVTIKTVSIEPPAPPTVVASAKPEPKAAAKKTSKRKAKKKPAAAPVTAEVPLKKVAGVQVAKPK